MLVPSQLHSIVSTPEEPAGTGPGGVGPDLDFHALWQRVFRERVLESRPHSNRLEISVSNLD